MRTCVCLNWSRLFRITASVVLTAAMDPLQTRNVEGTRSVSGGVQGRGRRADEPAYDEEGHALLLHIGSDLRFCYHPTLEVMTAVRTFYSLFAAC